MVDRNKALFCLPVLEFFVLCEEDMVAVMLGGLWQSLSLYRIPGSRERDKNQRLGYTLQRPTTVD